MKGTYASTITEVSTVQYTYIFRMNWIKVLGNLNYLGFIHPKALLFEVAIKGMWIH